MKAELSPRPLARRPDAHVRSPRGRSRGQFGFHPPLSNSTAQCSAVDDYWSPPPGRESRPVGDDLPTRVVTEQAWPAPVPDRRTLITLVGRSLSPSRASRPGFIATVIDDRGPPTRGVGQRRGNPKGRVGRPLGATTCAFVAPRERHTRPFGVYPPRR